jgi:hypothetical protein
LLVSWKDYGLSQRPSSKLKGEWGARGRMHYPRRAECNYREMVGIVLQTLKCLKGQGSFEIQFIPSTWSMCVGDAHVRKRLGQ